MNILFKGQMFKSEMKTSFFHYYLYHYWESNCSCSRRTWEGPEDLLHLGRGIFFMIVMRALNGTFKTVARERGDSSRTRGAISPRPVISWVGSLQR